MIPVMLRLLGLCLCAILTILAGGLAALLMGQPEQIRRVT